MVEILDRTWLNGDAPTRYDLLLNGCDRGLVGAIG
jgi:hypothetical protein